MMGLRITTAGLLIVIAAAMLGATAVRAQTTPTAQSEPIGNVVKLQGTASVTRDKASAPLKLKDDIYKNDVIQTGAASALGVTFDDATTLNLTANSRIAVDNYVYEDGGKSNSALFDVTKGTVAFVAAAVAKTGDMKITTPTSTLGIRGTTGLVEVPDSGAPNNIKLYPDPDGRVGRIEVNGRDGARLGLLTQGASGFSIRPGAGAARFAAVPLQIPPQQLARDQGIVRQVHAAQTSGRQIVTQQRALRRANPQRTPQQLRPGSPQRTQSPNTPPLQPRQVLPNRAGEQLRPQQRELTAPRLQRRTLQPPVLARPGSRIKPALPRLQNNQDRRRQPPL